MADPLFRVTIVQYWLRNAYVGRDGLPCSADAPDAVFVAARRVKKGCPGAELVRRKSKKWYARVKNNGVTKPVPLSANKVAARQMLAALERKEELRRAGVCDPFEA